MYQLSRLKPSYPKGPLTKKAAAATPTPAARTVVMLGFSALFEGSAVVAQMDQDNKDYRKLECRKGRVEF